MSKDLNNQLQNIIISPVVYDCGKYYTLSTDDIQQITDCFIADGWIKPKTGEAQDE